MKSSDIYRVKVKGKLDPGWSERMQGMRIAIEDSKEHGAVTILEGPLRDQAALSGVLNTLYELHFPVLLVEMFQKGDGSKGKTKETSSEKEVT
jgi:hypothetical protein